jgi:chaperonin cofactor prefoldin
MVEPDNFIVALLREMRAEMNERFQTLEIRMNGRFDVVDARFESMEKRLESVRQAAFGESLMARYTVAEVEDRLQDIEKRLATIEDSRSS